MAISIGQAIDTSVVILENVSNRIETIELDRAPNRVNYADRTIAAVEASTQEVESSLVAATAANLVSVLPFVLVGGFVSLLFAGTKCRSPPTSRADNTCRLRRSREISYFRPDADDRQPKVQIRSNWERANALGLTTQAIGRTIQTAIEGSVPTQLQRNERLVAWIIHEGVQKKESKKPET